LAASDVNSESPLLRAGDCVRGTYTVERLLGRGAFAEVYLVRHQYLGRQVLKILRAGPGTTDVAALLAEAQTLVNLTHPHIVRVYEANVDEVRDIPFAFLTMEWCPAGTLADRLRDGVRLSVEEVTDLGLQVCAGLAYAHALRPPLLHLDLKPSNLLLSAEGGKAVVKIGDFGVASRLNSVTGLAPAGGSLAFAAPELAWGVADERADVYSLGVTLYRALCGIHPFPVVSRRPTGTDVQFFKILSATRQRIVPPSRMLLYEVPDMDAVILRALAFDPFERFRNGEELRVALVNVRGS
jgi:serine/threonine protein kinase